MTMDFSRFKVLPVKDIKKADWNYKDDDEELSGKLAENIKEHGQVQNIIVRVLEDDSYEIVNGNHRLDVFVNLGIEKVYACDLGKISLEAAKRIAIETNETTFQADPTKLAGLIGKILEEISQEEFLVSAPYTDKDMDQFKEILADLEEEEYETVTFTLAKDTGERFKKQMARVRSLSPEKGKEAGVFSDVMQRFITWARAMDREDFIKLVEGENA